MTFPKFRGDSKFSTWAYHCCLNLGITLYHQQAHHQRLALKVERALAMFDFNYEEEQIKLHARQCINLALSI
jgi:RNA polymerase sigma-70 factor (ECF subfamily)